MAVGMVLRFNDEKGYGFIENDDGEQFFVHHRAIEMDGFRTLGKGDRVMFEIAITNRGAEAVKVKKLKEA